jgi:CDP-diacylglycerol--glycerol-3-phosphate 3-phosphatidyltransferase
MPSVYDLKPRFQALWQPLVARLPKWGITPNYVTGAALAGSVLVSGALVLGCHNLSWLLLLPPWLFVRMALNAMDGMLAREFGQVTPLGTVMNELGDVVSDLAIYLPLALVFPGSSRSVASFCLLAILSEFCGVLGPLLGTPREYGGPMGKSDRALLVAVVSLATALWPRFGNYWSLIFYAGAGLGVLTCVNRTRRILARSGAQSGSPNDP